jgi:hypothetical protein
VLHKTGAAEGRRVEWHNSYLTTHLSQTEQCFDLNERFTRQELQKDTRGGITKFLPGHAFITDRAMFWSQWALHKTGAAEGRRVEWHNSYLTTHLSMLWSQWVLHKKVALEGHGCNDISLTWPLIYHRQINVLVSENTIQDRCWCTPYLATCLS